MEIFKNFKGRDFVLNLGIDRKNTRIKLLQLTDMQFIDSSQMRSADRLRKDEIIAWKPENFNIQCANQIRSLITQSNPDLIFITGDMVYGSFDDNGKTFRWFCEFMDSFKIPWAPVFGNHDNESYMGIDWQCELLKNSEYCLFKRGEVSGNGNYTVGIAIDKEIQRVIYMLDSNGCLKAAGIYGDQFELVENYHNKIKVASDKSIPGFIAFHIPPTDFETAHIKKGYKTAEHNFYTIGVDVPAKDGDFGFCYEATGSIKTEKNFLMLLKDCDIDGVFVGHHHKICTCINYEGIKWVHGLKTGQYDFHMAGSLGGTLVTLEGNNFEVMHLPCLTPYAPFPSKAPMFKNFFTEE